jgi:hypothetical protein
MTVGRLIELLQKEDPKKLVVTGYKKTAEYLESIADVEGVEGELIFDDPATNGQAGDKAQVVVMWITRESYVEI